MPQRNSLDSNRDSKAKSTSAQERFRIAFQGVGIGIGLVDEQGKFVEVNDHLSEMFACAGDRFEGISLRDLSVPEGETRLQTPVRMASRSSPHHVSMDMQFVSGHGDIFWAEVDCLPSKDAVGLFIVSFHDITERKVLQTALEQQATLDPLTRALNRQTFVDRATIEVLRSGRHRLGLSVVMADLDRFKSINDRFGHASGDEVLAIFSEIAHSSLRVVDLLGRWGGEEFLILLPNTGASNGKRVCERIRKALAGHNFPTGLQVTVSMGIAAQRLGESLPALLDRADAAMYQAKQNGRNRVVVDAEDLRRESARNPNRFEPLELHWRKAYACGIPRIDAEHKELLRIANRLLLKLGSCQDNARISEMVDELLVHIMNHFSNEESMLEAGGFSDAEAHKQLHRKLLAHASDLAAQFRKRGTTAGAFLGFVIHDVLARHMIQEDRKYFPWIKQPAHAPTP
ncbi:MAG: diguanylate cyclase [Terracidiphilus sp.]